MSEIDDEAVERVAKAMHLGRSNSRRTVWDDCSDEYRTGTMLDARAAIAAMPSWRPIESAPKDGAFLVYMPEEHRKLQVMYRTEGSKIAVIGGAFAFDLTKPTHWQPLPPPPKPEGGQT